MENYPKSIHGHQCVSKCYPSNTNPLHPITLEYMKSVGNIITKDKPFCAIEPVKTEAGTYRISDICSKVSNNLNDTEIMDIIIPKISFDPSQFLKLYYDITSLEECLLWIHDHEAQNLPYKTIERNLNCALKAYGAMAFKDVIEDIIVVLFIVFVQKYWVKSYTKRLMKLNKEISFDSTINNNFMRTTLAKYYKQYSENWNNLNYTKLLKEFIFNEIKNTFFSSQIL